MTDEVTPQDDIVESLFGDSQENKETPENKENKTTPETPSDENKGEENKNEKVNVQEIVEQATKSVLSQVNKSLQQSGTDIQRQRAFDRWMASSDGKMFDKYAETIEKAALDPRFANIPVSQLPAVILKPAAYSKVLSDAKVAADKEAADSKAGGTGGRATPPAGSENEPDYKNMSREELNKV